VLRLEIVQLPYKTKYFWEDYLVSWYYHKISPISTFNHPEYSLWSDHVAVSLLIYLSSFLVRSNLTFFESNFNKLYLLFNHSNVQASLYKYLSSEIVGLVLNAKRQARIKLWILNKFKFLFCKLDERIDPRFPNCEIDAV